MMDAINQYQRLAKKLYERTKKGTLDWEEDPWTSKLVVGLRGHKVTLKRSESAEGEPLVLVAVVDDNGTHIDGFSDDVLSSYETGLDEAPTYWRLLDQLYSMAYRKAKGAEKALEGIISDLDLDDDVPF
jgi:hypothetical protein